MLTAPFPYAGGKRAVADLVWSQFGPLDAYVEPFAGSAAVFLACPAPARAETLNDASGHITNVWRSIQTFPHAVAARCDWPINEIDLFARHVALVQAAQGLTERLMVDPHYCDPELAAWWIWGASSWIGGGWCNGNGPWSVDDGKVVKRAGGVARQMPSVGARADVGSGWHVKGIHSARLRGVARQMPHVSANDTGSATQAGVHSPQLRGGVARQMPHIGGSGTNGSSITYAGVHSQPLTANLFAYFYQLSARLRDVRIVCGDWERVLSPRITTAFGTCGVFLDPPYPGTHTAFYEHGGTDAWHAAQAWAIEHGDDPAFRIALCGMDDQTMPDTWMPYRWKRAGGYGSQGDGAGRENAGREMIWFSPGCGQIADLPMFAGL